MPRPGSSEFDRASLLRSFCFFRLTVCFILLASAQVYFGYTSYAERRSVTARPLIVGPPLIVTERVPYTHLKAPEGPRAADLIERYIVFGFSIERVVNVSQLAFTCHESLRIEDSQGYIPGCTTQRFIPLSFSGTSNLFLQSTQKDVFGDVAVPLCRIDKGQAETM